MSMVYGIGLVSQLAEESDVRAALQEVATRYRTTFCEVLGGEVIDFRYGTAARKTRTLRAEEAAPILRVAKERGSAPASLVPGFFDDVSVVFPRLQGPTAPPLAMPGCSLDGCGVASVRSALSYLREPRSDESAEAVRTDIVRVLEICAQHGLIFVIC